MIFIKREKLQEFFLSEWQCPPLFFPLNQLHGLLWNEVSCMEIKALSFFMLSVSSFIMLHATVLCDFSCYLYS